MTLKEFDLISRIDERTGFLIRQLSQVQESIHDIEDRLDKNFVSQIEFKPVKRLVFGAAGLILSGTLVAVLTLIFVKP